MNVDTFFELKTDSLVNLFYNEYKESKINGYISNTIHFKGELLKRIKTILGSNNISNEEYLLEYFFMWNELIERNNKDKLPSEILIIDSKNHSLEVLV